MASTTDADRRGSPAPPSPVGPRGGVDVVVVDDDEGMRQAMTRMLQAAGLGVRTLAGVESLLAGRGDAPVRCWVVDVHLEGRSGLSVLEVLPSVERPPVVLVSADDSPSLRETARRHGVQLLTKPFSGHDLLAAVARACGAARPQSDAGGAA
jgi:FixJ family two-component response regulator